MTEPTVYERERPKLVLADGTEVTVRKPLGFAAHPAVPKQKLKGTESTEREDGE